MFAVNKSVAAFFAAHPKVASYLREVIHALILAAATAIAAQSSQSIIRISPVVAAGIVVLVPVVILVVNAGLDKLGLGGFKGLADAGIQQGAQVLENKVQPGGTPFTGN